MCNTHHSVHMIALGSGCQDCRLAQRQAAKPGLLEAFNLSNKQEYMLGTPGLL